MGSYTVADIPRTKKTIGQSSSLLLSSNLTRRAAYITNMHASAIVYISLGVGAHAGQGIPLWPKDTFQITVQNLWLGSVYAIATQPNVDVAIIEQ